jgi:diguanylate cyclase
MADRVRSRLLPGAPRWLIGLTLLTAVSFATFGAVRILAPQVTGGSHAVDLPALLVLHGLALGVTAWRARRIPTERAVWSRVALGMALFTAALLLAVALAFVPATSAGAAIPAYWAGVVVFPFWYGALVRWNRYGTSLADPNDVLNGAAAVLAVVAVLDVVVVASDGALSRLPWWQLYPLLAQFAVCFVLLGTALALPFIGAMGRDLRTWLVVAAFGTGLAGTTVTLLTGGERVGWGAVHQPVLVVCLTLAACLASNRSAPQATDPISATIGAFVVIVASTATLVTGTLAGANGIGIACAALAAVGAGIRMAINVRELTQLAVTRREALTDELTGLANRRALLRRISALSAEGTPVALALLDVDKFKEVNDALGHAAGDDLLRLVARRLETALRSGDLLGRLGGDEFAVVAPLDPGVPPEEAGSALARRLHEHLEAPFPLDGMFVHASASIGVTTSTDDGGRPTTLLRRADVAMYDAKRSGRGVALYDAALHAESSGHLALVEQLRTALTTDQLVLHHQPQLDIADGRVVGVECLVRWAHPGRGLLLPGEFLPLAEVHGLMGPLTERVLELSVAQAADWRGRGIDLRVSVNLSASNLLDTCLPARVRELLDRHAVPPSSVVLEVTESVLLTDPERSLAVLGDLADLGVTVSMDDFGTGYSSLAYLRDLPVTELKLDRSFTADLCTDTRTEAIIASTIDLAHRLGLGVVAEGVEDERTLHHLRTLGCDTSQGFLHSPALPAPVLERWLLDHEAAPAAG